MDEIKELEAKRAGWIKEIDVYLRELKTDLNNKFIRYEIG